MKAIKKLSPKAKVAVTVTATFLLLVFITVWIFMAVVTVHTINTYHFSGYTYTKVLKTLDNPVLSDVKNAVLNKEYAGLCLTPFYKDGIWYVGTQTTLGDAVTTLSSYGKILCVRINSPLSDDEQSDLYGNLRTYLSVKEFFFWAPDLKTAESLYGNRSSFVCFATASNRFSAFLITQMNYDVCLPVSCLTEKNVARSHENSHLISAYGSEESIDYAKKLHADFYLIS